MGKLAAIEQSLKRTEIQNVRETHILASVLQLQQNRIPNFKRTDGRK